MAKTNVYHLVSSLQNDNELQVSSERHTSQDSKQLHIFQIRFFYKPILCKHCRDFIWGQGYIGFGCSNCGTCVHTQCKIFLNSDECKIAKSDSNNINSQLSLESITRSNLFRIENWSIDIVKQWLAVVNLHRYSEVFSIYSINGAKLLTLDIYQLYAFRIRDSYHHAAILQARDELLYKARQYSTIQQMVKDQEDIKTHLVSNPYTANHHYFLLHTVSKLTDCEMCSRPLLGIIHQGLLCQQCGIVVHRKCSCNGLPNCKVKDMQVLISNKHHIFGVSLFDLISSQQQSTDTEKNIPFILVKAFKTIEERAYKNQEDLYDVYRLSADTSKIDQIKQQINENGIELTDFENYDLNTIAAIVKTFLRDLQDSVIPEHMYEKLMDNIQNSTSDELKKLITNSLDPLHYACLKYVMVHLIKVWLYQFNVIGCHYLPDKLFHIFRSILMRPCWENIQDIVINIDKQSLVIERLILECDWGIELPEYKVRPKRPLQEPSPANIVESESSYLKNELNTSEMSLKKHQKTTVNLSKALIDSRKGSLSSKESLNDTPWFWGDITRDDTILILKNCQDGSFLVRNSTDKSPSTPYTLCVMKGAFVKSIKIFKQELHDSTRQSPTYLYDIEKPCRFESVQQLINYYSRVSLKEYHHNLDLVLTNGMSKYKFGKTTDWSIEKLYSSYRDALNQYDAMTKRCDGLEADITNIREDLNNKRMASDAFDKIIQMYNEQVQKVDKTLSDNLLKKSSAISSTRVLVSQLMPTGFSTNSKNHLKDDEAADLDKIMQENKQRLKKRIMELYQKKEDIKSDIEYLNTVVNQLQEELDVLKPDVIEIRKKRENYHMWLLQRGENDNKIQTLLKSPESSSESLSNSNMKPSISMTDLTKIEVTSDLVSPHSSPLIKKKANNNAASIAAALALSSSKSESLNLSNISSSIESKISCSLYLNSLNWYKADCTRDEAIQILTSKENGTFLIRPSSHPNSKYIISLVYQNDIKHILIDENQNGCFLKSNTTRRLPPPPSSKSNDENLFKSNSIQSFDSNEKSLLSSPSSMSSLATIISNESNYDNVSEENKINFNQNNSPPKDSLKFKTLTELVMFYSCHEIKTNCINLDIKLIHPALSERF